MTTRTDDMTTFDPPTTFDVIDRHNGFTALTDAGTLWRPVAIARQGTLGTLIEGTINRGDFYQTEQPVISAHYKLPGYGYRVKVWWQPDGTRIA